MFNILTERLIRIASVDGICCATLPEALATLMADKVEAFPALRPHQRHAWHALLVQLGAMAMHRAGVSEPPTSAAEWKRLIRGLTPDWPDDEPWQLVVDDITKPAFMQPPASSADKVADYKNRVDTADGLDMLVTSKNHDLKASVGSQAGVDDWIIALVTLQTTEGYGGARNYGVSRMPSGYGNRSAFSITPSTRPGAHVKRDILVLLGHRRAILEDYQVTDNGIDLLWAKEWDGTKSETLLIDQLEPFYIDICRRVRLRQGDGKLEALRANSASRRIADIKGLTGDPWVPVSNNANLRGTPPAFLGPRKFGYERIVDGLFSPDWKEPYLLRVTDYDRQQGEEMVLVARGMVRGEGGTSGYHERVITLRSRTVSRLRRPGEHTVLGDIARERITNIRNVQRILRHAVATFAAKGDSRRGEHRNGNPSPNDLANPWVDQLDEIVDYRFFDHLQAEFEADEGTHRNAVRKTWLADFLIANAETVLKSAWASLPCPDGHYRRALATSQNVFNGRTYREFDISVDQPQEQQP